MKQPSANELCKEAWEANAEYWDDYIGEGNSLVERTIWPATLDLIKPAAGSRVLDAACGNGLYARKLSKLGASVDAFDISPRMIARAKRRGNPGPGVIIYQVLDATCVESILSAFRERYDFALCQMALFDMAEIEPLLQALGQLLRPNGLFVFSILHPCFNSGYSVQLLEREDHEGVICTRAFVKMGGYLTSTQTLGCAVEGQPVPQPLFHRSLEAVIGACCKHGFVVDGIREPRVSTLESVAAAPKWSQSFADFPPVLLVRLQLLAERKTLQASADAPQS